MGLDGEAKAALCEKSRYQCRYSAQFRGSHEMTAAVVGNLRLFCASAVATFSVWRNKTRKYIDR